MKNLLLLLLAAGVCFTASAQCGGENYTEPQFTLSVQNIQCPLPGEIRVEELSGGTAPYTFTLLPNGTTSSTGTFTNLEPGTYLVQLKDACGTIRTRQASLTSYAFTTTSTLTPLGCEKYQFTLATTAQSAVMYGYTRQNSGDTTWSTSNTLEGKIAAPATLFLVVKDECGKTAVSQQYIPREMGGYIKALNERIMCNGQEIYPEYYGFNAPTVCLYKHPQGTLVDCRQAPAGAYNGGAATNFFNLPFGQDYYVIVQDGCSRDSAFFRDKTSIGGSELNPFAWNCNTFDLHADGNNYDTVCLWNATTNTLVGCKKWNDTAINPNTGKPWPYGGAEFYNLPYGSYYAFIFDPCLDTLVRIDTTVRYPYRSAAETYSLCEVGTSTVAVKFMREAPTPWTTEVYWPTDSLVGRFASSGASWYHSYPTYPHAGNVKIVTEDGCGKRDTTYLSQPTIFPVRRVEAKGGCPGIYGDSGGGDIILSGEKNAYANNWNNWNNGAAAPVTIIEKDGQPVSIPQSFTQENAATGQQQYQFTNLPTGSYVLESSLGCYGYKVYDTITIQPYVYPVQEQNHIVQCGTNTVVFEDSVSGGLGPLNFEILSTSPALPSMLTGPQASPSFLIPAGINLDTIQIRVTDACANAHVKSFPVLHQDPCLTLPVTERPAIPHRREEPIRIYPNPSTQQFTLQFSAKKKTNYRVHITNAVGSAVYTKTFDNIDFASIPLLLRQPPGLYFIQITNLQTNLLQVFKQVVL